MERQKKMLAILLGLLVLSLLYGVARMPRQKSVEKLTYTPGKAAPVKPAAVPGTADERRLRLDLLAQPAQRFAGFRRNIFKPIFHEEQRVLPPPPPPPAKPTAPPPAKVEPPPVAKAPEPSPVQRDMARFTFLGFLKKDNKKTIFLSSDKELFLVKKGEKIAGKYEVANITDEALTITKLGEGGEIIIPLVENKPLSSPR